MHTNDTRVELGANRDLHWHVAQGKIGSAGFRALLTAPELAHVAAICETPDSEMDARNVAMLRRLAGSGTKPQQKKGQTELSRAKSGRKRV